MNDGGLFGSQARPGMNGTLGSLAGSCFSGGSSLAGSSLAGDSLGAQIYTLTPTNGVDFDGLDPTDPIGARQMLQKYGDTAARTLITQIKKLPAKHRAKAMRQAMTELDPKLYDRAQKYAAETKHTDPKVRLQAGISRAVVEGFVDQLHQLGTQQKRPQELGLLCGLVPYEEKPEPMGIWGLSWLATQISGGTKPVTQAVQENIVNPVTSGVKSAINAIKDLTCGIVQGGGADAAASAAQSAPSPQTVGVAVGAQVASNLCGSKAVAPPPPPPPQTNYLPYILGGGALLIGAIILTRKH